MIADAVETGAEAVEGGKTRLSERANHHPLWPIRGRLGQNSERRRKVINFRVIGFFVPDQIFLLS